MEIFWTHIINSTTVWHKIFAGVDFEDGRYFAFRGNKFSRIRISDFTAGKKFSRISVVHVFYLYITTRKYNVVLFIYFKFSILVSWVFDTYYLFLIYEKN